MSSTSSITHQPPIFSHPLPSRSTPQPLEPSPCIESKPTPSTGLFEPTLLAADALRKSTLLNAQSSSGTSAIFTDPHSFSNPQEASISHLTLSMRFDPAQEQMHGNVTLDITNHTATNWIHLDCKELEIVTITDASGNPLDWHLGLKDAILGQKLSIHIPNDQSATSVKIQYVTSPHAEGLYWHTKDPDQFLLYSHSQPHYTRSWLPCQDSPQVRMTYDVTITTDPRWLAVMSCGNNPKEKTSTGVYHLKMEIPIPSYLMAFCVGNLEYLQAGPRTGVYAHPSMIGKAHNEFRDILETVLTTAETHFGEYLWGRYDMLFLPVNFPAGATENPMITFFSSAISAGDRSLAYYLFHEAAHSWAGNLTTTKGWEHLWLNEGMTTFFELFLAEMINGKDYADMLAKTCVNELLEEIADSNGADSELRMHLKGRNPRDSFSSIPYYKGYLFLKMLENHCGRETFFSFLRKYFADHRFQSVTTEEFELYLSEHLLNGDETLNIKEWLYEKGLPANCPTITSTRIDQVDQIAAHWTQSGDLNALVESTKSFSTHEWVYLLQILKRTSCEHLARLDEHFNFSQHPNYIIREEWFTTAADSHYTGCYPQLKAFVLEVCKPRVVKKFLSKLVKSPGGHTLAHEIYAEGKPHFYARSLAAADAILAN